MQSSVGVTRKLDQLEELLHVSSCTPDRVCKELATIFDVKPHEVALLRVDSHALRFVYPAQLQSAGFIPLSSSAVAARTAVGKIPELFNQFAAVPHHTFFETVKLTEEQLTAAQQTIQKLMSAPILDERNETLGVVQVCRKGITPAAAGADFTVEELELLERAARRIAYLVPELLSSSAKSPAAKLTFQGNTLAKKKA